MLINAGYGCVAFWPLDEVGILPPGWWLTMLWAGLTVFMGCTLVGRRANSGSGLAMCGARSGGTHRLALSRLVGSQQYHQPESNPVVS